MAAKSGEAAGSFQETSEGKNFSKPPPAGPGGWLSGQRGCWCHVPPPHAQSSPRGPPRSPTFPTCGVAEPLVPAGIRVCGPGQDSGLSVVLTGIRVCGPGQDSGLFAVPTGIQVLVLAGIWVVRATKQEHRLRGNGAVANNPK